MDHLQGAYNAVKMFLIVYLHIL